VHGTLGHMSQETPLGVFDLLPSEAERYSKVTQLFKSTFTSFGYAPIKTPTVEYYDVIKPAFGSQLDSKTVKFFDASGQVLVLRPDHTSPIARIVSSRMSAEDLPLRLYYLDPIFRKNDGIEPMEQFQAGLELIGASGPEADAEVLMVLIDSIKNAGITDFGIDIGHIDFLKGLSEEDKKSLLAGDYLSLGRIPERGGLEVIEDHSELKEVYRILSEKGYAEWVTFNKGLVKEIQYYTGIVFEAYYRPKRMVIGSGGRYDSLLSQFDFDQPAIGFAVNSSKVQGLLS
jgi:ATP phosphoribosyltransferase regulatory subunit